MPEVMRPAQTPTDKVLQMRSQGVSNNQIIQILQRDGYDLTAIFNAMNQADIRGGVDSNTATASQAMPAQGGETMAQPLPSLQYPGQEQPAQEYGQQEMPQDYGQAMPQQFPQEMPPQQQMPAMEMPQQYPQQYPQQEYQGPSFDSQRIEELAEAIIDEKWNEIVRSINKIIDWKERVEARVNKIEQQLEDLNKSMDTLHKGVLGKITDYDQNLTNVGAEIKAMEKVFQKVLPSLTESVSELGRITDGMKKK
jgi:hypothetical protein